jgi:hypothetical protein
MKKIDILITLFFGCLFWVTYTYVEGPNRYFYLVFSGTMAVIFLILSFRQPKQRIVEKKKKGQISTLALLDENNHPVAHFDLYNKVGVLLGKDKKNQSVDINLSNSNFASTIDYEHAVMNYASGAWYIEDLYSKNGVAIQKKADGRKYALMADKPCKVEAGDIIFIGLTKLLVR